jgi:RluA family pseudouridine synthase
LLTVLHEDNHLIAVSKPSGQLVIPGRGPSGQTLREEVEECVRGKVFVVHRLDQGASGVVLFAKDPGTHRQLCLDFENHRIEKIYLVLVRGRLERDGRVDQPLREFGSGRVGVDSRGKPSVTEFKVREKFEAATLLEVRPQSGRRHQIRVHLYSLNHPVMGDTRYGAPRPVGGISRLMLHAFRVKTEGGGDFKADPPEDFLRVLNRFRAG